MFKTAKTRVLDTADTLPGNRYNVGTFRAVVAPVPTAPAPTVVFLDAVILAMVVRALTRLGDFIASQLDRVIVSDDVIFDAFKRVSARPAGAVGTFRRRTFAVIRALVVLVAKMALVALVERMTRSAVGRFSLTAVRVASEAWRSVG